MMWWVLFQRNSYYIVFHFFTCRLSWIFDDFCFVAHTSRGRHACDALSFCETSAMRKKCHLVMLITTSYLRTTFARYCVPHARHSRDRLRHTSENRKRQAYQIQAARTLLPAASHTKEQKSEDSAWPFCLKIRSATETWQRHTWLHVWQHRKH